MDQRIINLFDEYTHKPLSRQEFMDKLVRLTGSLAAAMSVLPLLEVSAKAATPTTQDDSLLAEDITYPGEGMEMKAYLVKPKTGGSKGAVMVVHENRGLNPHIRDVTRRMAREGFIAMAPDALSVNGGTPANEDEARTQIGQLDKEKNLANFLKGLVYLRNHKEGNGKTGVMGFCWGGAMANSLAVNDPSLNAAIAFYGMQAKAEDVPKIKAFVQLHYAGLDERINAGIKAYDDALKAAGTRYESFFYEGVNHAFHNDASAARYNEAAAKLAWQRSTDLLKRELK